VADVDDMSGESASAAPKSPNPASCLTGTPTAAEVMEAQREVLARHPARVSPIPPYGREVLSTAPAAAAPGDLLRRGQIQQSSSPLHV
jgi:hypothetical protein